MKKIEIGQIRKEWRGWDGYDEFFEADEWATFENDEEYNEAIKGLKKQGFKVYYQDEQQTLFV